MESGEPELIVATDATLSCRLHLEMHYFSNEFWLNLWLALLVFYIAEVLI
jgi:hypothetical protein